MGKASLVMKNEEEKRNRKNRQLLAGQEKKKKKKREREEEELRKKAKKGKDSYGSRQKKQKRNAPAKEDAEAVAGMYHGKAGSVGQTELQDAGHGDKPQPIDTFRDLYVKAFMEAFGEDLQNMQEVVSRENTLICPLGIAT